MQELLKGKMTYLFVMVWLGLVAFGVVEQGTLDMEALQETVFGGMVAAMRRGIG